jgi:hypothetical protein
MVAQSCLSSKITLDYIRLTSLGSRTFAPPPVPHPALLHVYSIINTRWSCCSNEINGLTMGGVGAGTQVDHIEVAFNADDGVEMFGGTVDAKVS